MILVLTNERDLTTDYVVMELRRRGVPYIRLNSERFAEAMISFDPKNGEDAWIINIDDKIIDFSKIRSAYFRRPGSPIINSCFSNEAVKRYCQVEWGAALTSALNSLEGRWLNSPLNILAAENKSRQLALAHSIGFTIPDTLISNDFAQVQKFSSSGEIVAKPLREALLDDNNEERVIFTNRVDKITKQEAFSVNAAPVIYQTEILKYADIRATVVGDTVYAVEILSQIYDETTTDWRRGIKPDLPHNVHELPDEVIIKCVQLVHKLGLRFGAIDLVLDKNRDYWFLEVNPNGQWAWIENRTGLPITNAIVNELERISACSC